MAKITITTIKSFIKKNPNLFIKVRSEFDGMVDGITFNSDAAFNLAKPSDRHFANNMGIQGAWFVLNSRDWFNAFENDNFIGYEVSNSCGSFILAIKK